MKSSALAILSASLLLAQACDSDRQEAHNGGGNEVVAPANAAASRYGGAAGAARTELRLASGGFLATASGPGPARTIAFGAPRSEAVAAVSAILGPASEEGSNEECGAGPMQFTHFGTLSLNFQNDAFVGWFLRRPARTPPLRSATGVGIGTPRDQIVGEGQGPLEVSETSIGTQFEVGGIFGLLSGPEPDAAVTDLWAGTNCIFH